MVRRTVGRHDLSTIEGQSAAVAAAVPLLERLGDPVRQSEYAHLLAELAGVSEGSVVLALEQKLSGRPAEVQQAVKRASAQEKVEREMLRILARDADAFRRISPRLSDEHFRTTRHRELLQLLRDRGGHVSGSTAEGGDEEVVEALTALALEPLDGDLLPGTRRRSGRGCRSSSCGAEATALRQELQKMNPVTDPRYDEMFQRLIAADGELRRLRERGHDAA